MKVLKEGPAYNTKVWHSLICQVHVLLQIRKAKWLLKSASASTTALLPASLKLKEWKPKCSTYTLKVPFPLVLWLYFQMLFFGYIRFELNFQDLPPLPLLQQHGKINFVNVPTYFYSPKVNTIFKWCCVAHYNVIKNVKSKHVTHLSFSYNLQKSILL